ncbi:unknown protein [Seminavis robusta]|uniref:DUF6818 domain-containing protein n=1 Tax=Seminavis robusta TaxID=568900 RepID=A0A9N8E8U2_9STRA|nr:unknown protein [Seminavis robusta]|eukprot:Sro621_g176840.1 n/a (349) ;mRNA; r:43876-44922
MQAEKPSTKEKKKSKGDPRQMEAAAGAGVPPPNTNRRAAAAGYLAAGAGHSSFGSGTTGKAWVPVASSFCTANNVVQSEQRKQQQAVKKYVEEEEKKKKEAAGTMICDLRTPPSNVSNLYAVGSNPPPAPSIARKPLPFGGYYNMEYEPALYGINAVPSILSATGHRSGRASAPPSLPSPEQQRRQGLMQPSKDLAVSIKKEQTVKPNKKKSGKSKLGASAWFTEEERNDLFDEIKKALPIGKLEWEKVGEAYNKKNADRPREMPNLRAQFNKYALAKPPTGDPDCPPLVREAKQIARMIKEKAGMDNMAENGDPFNQPYSSHDTTPTDTSKSQTKAVKKKAKQASCR